MTEPAQNPIFRNFESCWAMTLQVRPTPAVPHKLSMNSTAVLGDTSLPLSFAIRLTRKHWRENNIYISDMGMGVAATIEDIPANIFVRRSAILFKTVLLLAYVVFLCL